MVTAPPESAVAAYAEAVIRGDVVTGKLVRQACERHIRDLGNGEDRGLWFDDEAADKAVRFFGLLKHSKGEWAGQPFVLEPWQHFIVGSIFGWKRTDGTRRFRTAYIELARKNGKSTLAAGIGLYVAFFDGEPGAEVYAAATKRDQAKIIWGEAKRMVQRSADLKAYVNVLAVNLHSEPTASKFEPLGADEDSTDGLNIHCAIIDELHAHKTRKMWDVLETATGSRRQPLVMAVTTSGYDRNSICWEQHDYGCKVLDDIIPDDSYFAFIATIDEGDDWADPDCWLKANPNLGVSVKLDDLERLCERAKQMPAAQNSFKRLRLDVWTEQAERWLDMAVWDECAGEVEEAGLEGRACYAGLDLSTTTDFTALVLAFPDEEGGMDVLSYFWIPADTVQRRVVSDRVPCDVWVREGYVEATSGNVVDYDSIRTRIGELGKRFDIREIAIDRWNSTGLQTQLDGDGFTVVPMGQGFASMSAPTKEVEKLALGRQVRHGGNPVLRWMASNVAVEQDAAGNLKPSKRRSTERIDGIVALVMAVDRATRGQGEGESVYNSRGLVVL